MKFANIFRNASEVSCGWLSVPKEGWRERGREEIPETMALARG
jgi:hypothetical protein